MPAAVEAIYKKNNQAFPRLTFIIVGKRHHFRFFPQDQQSTDPKGNNNLFAGFVVDQGWRPAEVPSNIAEKPIRYRSSTAPRFLFAVAAWSERKYGPDSLVFVVAFLIVMVGTASRPSHYTVLTNGDKWSADEYVYYLTYVF